MELSSQEVQRAADMLRTKVVHTPMLSSADFNTRLQQDVLVKAENIQRGGSFKYRGARCSLASMPREQRVLGVIGASSGNHGRTVSTPDFRSCVTDISPISRAS
ncbi:pyridoxal-phosphate dependent enzyme (plasmid) [Streptomyces sp. NBC_01527]|uniref:pyridoxal-phosphate dependent enzyme n=1 Tax=unclassified Streptomyces TaxID=2593676 RepID=UPI002E0F0892|nr:pyridoxal-phosphate dependent enzyme [Streptomyces sp. NBC_01230]